MPKQNFFDLGTGETKIKKTKKSSQSAIGCEACRLHHDCDNPKFEIEGPKNGVLFILDNPSAAEDESGKKLSGESGKYFKKLPAMLTTEYKKYAKHFAVTYAVKCNGKINDVAIKECSSRLWKEIDDYKPKIIIPLGIEATKAILQNEVSGRLNEIKYESFFGQQIPLKHRNYWVCPTYVPWYVLSKKDRDINYENFYLQHIEKALACFDKEMPEIDLENVECLKDENLIRKAIKYFQSVPTFAFDYESTGIKPHADYMELKTMSISDGKRTVAFPLLKKIENDVISLLESSTQKIAHNLAFEDMWSYYKLETQVNNWYWDTMLCAHCIDNKGKTGLKFQIFSKLGIIYDDKVGEFLKSSKANNDKFGGNAKNNIEKAPLDDLLYYNGLDSLLTFHLYEQQKVEICKNEKMYSAFKFLVEGAVALSQVQRNGICYNKDAAAKQTELLTKKIRALHKKIMDSAEVKNHWKRKNEFNPNSDTDMPKMLYDYLGYKKPENGGLSDETALLKIGTSFCNDIIKYRKALKLRDTYIAQFDREQFDNKIYPFFNLHIARTFRSSSSSPNFQNIPKRDKEAQKRIRTLLSPSPGNILIEYDYKAVEVCISACNHKDSKMIKYIEDPSNDMHRDTAADIFMKKADEVTKSERQIGKNGFVFPAFYGSTAKSIAPAIWEDIEKDPELRNHLKNKGIKNFSKFQSHIENVEDIFWNERFSEYRDWKQRLWKKYQKTGFVDMHTGFRAYGPMDFTKVTNYPIQGPAFHCLLFTLINMQNKLNSGFCPRSKIIGQIHDSLVCDVHPDEVADFDKYVKIIGTKMIRKRWPWIIVPLTIEKEMGDVNGDWTTLKECEI